MFFFAEGYWPRWWYAAFSHRWWLCFFACHAYRYNTPPCRRLTLYDYHAFSYAATPLSPPPWLRPPFSCRAMFSSLFWYALLFLPSPPQIYMMLCCHIRWSRRRGRADTSPLRARAIFSSLHILLFAAADIIRCRRPPADIDIELLPCRRLTFLLPPFSSFHMMRYAGFFSSLLRRFPHVFIKIPISRRYATPPLIYERGAAFRSWPWEAGLPHEARYIMALFFFFQKIQAPSAAAIIEEDTQPHLGEELI